jgi:hypothetical protein
MSDENDTEAKEAENDARDSETKPCCVIIDIPDQAAFEKLPAGIQEEAESLRKAEEKLYRVEFQVHMHVHRHKDGDFSERQLKIIFKYRKYDMVGEFTFHVNDRVQEVQEASGRPSYGAIHRGLKIHLREGLLPNDMGYVRGRFEINRRHVPVYQMADPNAPVTMPDGTTKALKDIDDHPQFLEMVASGAIPISMFGLAVENEFLSVNVFPIGPDERLYGRMAVVVIEKASRRDQDEYEAMLRKIEKATTVARKHGAFHSFGPDRNNSFVHIYPPEGKPDSQGKTAA